MSRRLWKACRRTSVARCCVTTRFGSTSWRRTSSRSCYGVSPKHDLSMPTGNPHPGRGTNPSLAIKMAPSSSQCRHYAPKRGGGPLDVTEFNDWLSEHSLQGYWTLDRGPRGSGPRAGFSPHLWRWADMATALDRATELIPPEDSFRRFVGFVHPELKTGASHTVLLGAQLVNPGEKPEAHRHTMAAIRFVVSGGGAATVVNGEEF